MKYSYGKTSRSFYIWATVLSGAFGLFVAFAQWKTQGRGEWLQMYLATLALWLILMATGYFGFGRTVIQIFDDRITWQSGLGREITCLNSELCIEMVDRKDGTGCRLSRNGKDQLEISRQIDRFDELVSTLRSFTGPGLRN